MAGTSNPRRRARSAAGGFDHDGGGGLGAEATPYQRFDPSDVKAFKVRESGHATTVLPVLGYLDPAKAVHQPIPRLDADQMFTFV